MADTGILTWLGLFTGLAFGYIVGHIRGYDQGYQDRKRKEYIWGKILKKGDKC